jgi:ABC-type sugar transport system permease subunit
VNKVLKKHRTSLLFLFPAFFFYTVFIIYPTIVSIPYSFFSWNGLSENMVFIGLENYKNMFTSSRFYNSMGNTFLYAVSTTILVNIFALMLALLVDNVIKGKTFFRNIIFIPVLLSGIVLGFIWSIMYNSNFGIINAILETVGLEQLTQDWLGNPDLARFSLIITMVWKNLGYHMIIYLAALQSIPKDLIESASLDGATAWNRFWKITFPLLAGAVTINVTLAFFHGMKIFEEIAVMTDGGPGFTTENLPYQIYKVAFANYQYGYGTALAVVLFVLTMILTIAQNKFLRKREVDL